MTSLTPGDPAPWFVAASATNPTYSFGAVAGRYVALAFFGSAAAPGMRAFLDAVAAAEDAWSVEQACFVGVTQDPADREPGRLPPDGPAFRVLFDLDRAVGRAYGVLRPGPAGEGGAPAGEVLHPVVLLLDPNLRVLSIVPLADPARGAARLLAVMRALPRIGAPVTAAVQAPVLVIPRVFERDLCRELIALYDAHGGQDSGFMRERDGKTVAILDYKHKRRSDYVIEDQAMRARTQELFRRRVLPEIRKAFQFQATRMERYIVACYEAEVGGHFRAHRDNTTKGTAHRRFAVTLNLNAEEYEGGELRFPEYGPQTFKAPTGGAVVFSCSLLHEARPVLSGRRYVFLPFLYDEAAARQRQANNRFLDESVGAYNPAPTE